MTTSATGGSVSDGALEAEYITNLKQQVYYLQLEVDFLRKELAQVSEDRERDYEEVSLRAAEHEEATFQQWEHERAKLEDQWGTRYKSLEAQLRQREGVAQALEKQALAERDRAAGQRDTFSKERAQFLTERSDLQKRIEGIERECARKEEQLARARDELAQRTTSALKAEKEIEALRLAVEQQSEAGRAQQSEVARLTAEVARLVAVDGEKDRLLQQKQAAVDEEMLRPWKEELRDTRGKLKQTELQVDQERALREKVAGNCTSLVGENALLSTQLGELQRLLEKEHNAHQEKSLRESTSSKQM